MGVQRGEEEEEEGGREREGILSWFSSGELQDPLASPAGCSWLSSGRPGFWTLKQTQSGGESHTRTAELL